ncbi:MAG: hypothetical protein Q7S73_01500 [bacterium]|nr:hypothetical protein [bacterium]
METAIAPKQTPERRFAGIIGKALKLGLETTVLKSEFEIALKNGLILPDGISAFDPNADGSKPEAKTIYLRHLGTRNEVELEKELLFSMSTDAKPLIVTFPKIPDDLDYLFQRMHFRHTQKALPVLGLLCGRFTMFPDREEKSAFSIQHQNQTENEIHGDIWLDWYSKTECWNPLLVKYRLKFGAPAFRSQEFGYLKIDANFDEKRNIVVMVSRITATDVPEFLKNTPTFPL